MAINPHFAHCSLPAEGKLLQDCCGTANISHKRILFSED